MFSDSRNMAVRCNSDCLVYQSTNLDFTDCFCKDFETSHAPYASASRHLPIRRNARTNSYRPR
jgi:hypothetical protein